METLKLIDRPKVISETGGYKTDQILDIAVCLYELIITRRLYIPIQKLKCISNSDTDLFRSPLSFASICSIRRPHTLSPLLIPSGTLSIAISSISFSLSLGGTSPRTIQIDSLRGVGRVEFLFH